MTLALPFDLGRGKARLMNLRSYMNGEARRAYGTLRVGANVANGETVTIGSDVFEVDIINTDSAADTVGALANTTADTVLTIDGATTPSWVVGDLIRVENEICRIAAVHSSTVFTLQRARCGTSAALHADNTDIYESDTPGTIIAAGRIPVGLVTTLTPAVFTPALADEINSDAGSDGNANACRAISLDTGAVMLLAADDVGAVALATTETLGGAGNAWDAATMAGGSDPVRKRIAAFAHTVTAAEVTLGHFYVPCDFDPSAVIVDVRDATLVPVAWVGAVTVVAASGGNPAYIKVDNSGATDWDADDIVTVLAFE